VCTGGCVLAGVYWCVCTGACVCVSLCVCVLFAAFFSCGHLIGEIKVLMSYCTVIMLYRYIIRHEMFVINCHND